MLQARFWLINMLQVSAKIQKDKEKSKGVKLFLLAGWLLLLGVAEATLRLDWKDIPLRNTTLQTVLLSTFHVHKLFPLMAEHRKNTTRQRGPLWGSCQPKYVCPLKLGLHLFFGSQMNYFLYFVVHLYRTPSVQACIVAKINVVYFHCLIKSCLNYQLCNEKSWLAPRC